MRMRVASRSPTNLYKCTITINHLYPRAIISSKATTEISRCLGRVLIIVNFSSYSNARRYIPTSGDYYTENHHRAISFFRRVLMQYHSWRAWPADSSRAERAYHFIIVGRQVTPMTRRSNDGRTRRDAKALCAGHNQEYQAKSNSCTLVKRYLSL